MTSDTCSVGMEPRKRRNALKKSPMEGVMPDDMKAPADTPMVLVPRGLLERVLSYVPSRGPLAFDVMEALSASPAREGDLGSSASPIPSGGLSGAAAAALRPCPFSGHTGSREGPTQQSGLSVERFKSPAGGFAYQVACCCGVRGRPERERGDAIHAWNVRAAPSPGEGDAPVACSHEPYQGSCVHCGVPFRNGRPVRPTPAAPEGLRELPLGTPVEVEFSEPEVGKQVLYVAGVMMGEQGMTEPEYWLSDTWPVRSRGDITTDWKREQFTPLAALQPQAEGE